MHFGYREYQRGNIFAALFGATALVGVLGAAAMHTLVGPVTTVQRVTQKNIAQNNLILSARILISAAGIAGDADGDGIVEPPPFRNAGTMPSPVNGGLLPNDLGLTLTDPWGSDYGLCVWDHGADNTSSNRIAGDTTAGAAVQTVLAVVAAGPDKQFQTTCDPYTAGAVAAAKAAGSDDLIFAYSYAEASQASGGLWTLNQSDANTAELKDTSGVANITADRSGGIINATGITAATVSASSSANDTLRIGGGLLLDTSSGSAVQCGAAEQGALRLDVTISHLEICNGSAWIVYAAVTDGDKGDLTVSGSGLDWQIDASAVGSSEIANASIATAHVQNAAVTYAKIQNITSSRLLGRSTAGAGPAEEISLGSGLNLSGGVLSASLASETDPQVATLTAGKWCAANGAGNAIDCTSDAPSGSGGLVSLQVFESSGTWTKPADLVAVEVICTGGGGGGGGSGDDGGNRAGAGGGGGGTASKVFMASDLTASVSITIGAGGAGGTATGNGGSGGNTSFGSYISATGGTGGLSGDAAAVGGSGGSGTSGQWNTTGNAGAPTITGIPNSLGGGASFWGGAGAGVSFNQVGQPGQKYGGGGSGASTTDATPSVGGAGGPGVCMITEHRKAP